MLDVRETNQTFVRGWLAAGGLALVVACHDVPAAIVLCLGYALFWGAVNALFYVASLPDRAVRGFDDWRYKVMYPPAPPQPEQKGPEANDVIAGMQAAYDGLMDKIRGNDALDAAAKQRLARKAKKALEGQIRDHLEGGGQ